MARYWVGNGGSWTGTTHWSASSGGANGASEPSSSDDVIFDANSFSSSSQTVTIGSNSHAKTFITSGVLNSPAFNITSILFLYGNFTLTSDVGSFGGTGDLDFKTTGGNVDFGGLSVTCSIHFGDVISGSGTPTWNLLSEIVSDNSIEFIGSRFQGNGFNITCSNVGFSDRSFNECTVESGSFSIWTLNCQKTTVAISVEGNDGYCTILLETIRIVPLLSGTPNITFNSVSPFDSSDSVINLGYINFSGDSNSGQITAITYDLSTGFNWTANEFNVIDFTVITVSIVLESDISYTINPDVEGDGFFKGDATHQILVSASGVNRAIVKSNTGSSATSYVTLTNIESQVGGSGAVTVPYYDYPGGVDGGGNLNWVFGQVNPNIYLQNTFFVGADLNGDVQRINIGKDDDGTPIYYELETQGIEFGNVFHRHKISDKLVVFTKDGLDSSLQGKVDNDNYKDIPIELDSRVNIGQDIDLEGNTIKFKWYGEVNESTPILEGFYCEKITDLGVTKG